MRFVALDSDVRDLAPDVVSASVRWEAGNQAFIVGGYAAVRHLLRSDQLVLGEVATMLQRLSARMEGGFSSLRLLTGTTHPFQNEPAHGLTRPWFREVLVRIVQRWTPAAISAWMDARLDMLESSGAADAVCLLAEALPEAIVADAMGLAPAEVHRIAVLSRQMSEIWKRRVHALRDLQSMERAAAGLVDLLDRRAASLRHVLGHPAVGNDDRHDYARLAFLVAAGVETTAGALASALDLLSHFPELQVELHRHPSKVAAFVEEVLRLYPPLRRSVARITLADLNVDGTAIPRGSRVLLDIERANRDPSVFDRPDDLDLARGGPTHLTFGGGAHACVGATLAKVELRAALGHIVANYTLRRNGNAQLRPGDTFRQYDSLPLQFLKLAT